MIKHRHEHQLYKHLILHLHAFVINFAGISTIFDSVTLTYVHIVFSKLSSFLFILLFFIKYLTAMLILMLILILFLILILILILILVLILILILILVHFPFIK